MIALTMSAIQVGHRRQFLLCRHVGVEQSLGFPNLSLQGCKRD